METILKPDRFLHSVSGAGEPASGDPIPSAAPGAPLQARVLYGNRGTGSEQIYCGACKKRITREDLRCPHCGALLLWCGERTS